MKTRLTVDVTHDGALPSSFRLVAKPQGIATMVDIISEQKLEDSEGCKHPIENWSHQLFDGVSGPQDAYYCGYCGELMQVG